MHSKFRHILCAAATASVLVVTSACERTTAAPPGVAQAPSQAQARAEAQRRATTPDVRLSASIVEVAPGIHLLGGTSPNASYVIETSDGLALIDTCQQADARPLTEQLKAIRLDVRRLKWIFLTHAHGDHSLGARRLRETTGAAVYAGRGDCSVLRAGGPSEAFFSVFEGPPESHPTPVDVELAGDEVIDLGDARIRAISTPGHTPGSVCYLLEQDGLRVLFTGDVVASLTDSVPLAGPGIYSAFLSPRFRGDAESSLTSLRKLLAMDTPDLVLPGHPRLDPTPADPRVTPKQWQALLTSGIRKLDTLVARRRRDGGDFLDGTPKELLPGLHYWGDEHGCAVYALVTAANELYLFDAPDIFDPVAFVQRRCEESGLPRLVPKAVLLTSSGSPATDGLRRLVEKTKCIVVAPSAGLDEVRRLCPVPADVRAAEDLPAEGWFPVRVLPVEGPVSPSVAYALNWRGSSVLFAGRYPVAISSGEDVGDLRSRLPTAAAVQAFRETLDRLGRESPNLLLPLVPMRDQSADLYDDAWAQLITANRAAVD